MPPQARLGHIAKIPNDAHGGKCCSHACQGPAIEGSPNVNVNGMPALRIGDPGIHSGCCGANTWRAKTGSKVVMINGKGAHREGDATRHCGGMGTLIKGSPDVFTGG